MVEALDKCCCRLARRRDSGADGSGLGGGGVLGDEVISGGGVGMLHLHEGEFGTTGIIGGPCCGTGAVEDDCSTNACYRHGRQVVGGVGAHRLRQRVTAVAVDAQRGGRRKAPTAGVGIGNLVETIVRNANLDPTPCRQSRRGGITRRVKGLGRAGHCQRGQQQCSGYCISDAGKRVATPLVMVKSHISLSIYCF